MKSLEEVIASGMFHPNIADNIKKAQSLEMDDSYRLRLQKRSELQQRVMKIMADDRLDAIVFPHQKRLVVPVGETPGRRSELTDTARAMTTPIIFIGEAPGGVMRRHFYGQSSRDPQGILASC